MKTTQCKMKCISTISPHEGSVVSTSMCFLWPLHKQRWPCVFSLHPLPPVLPVCVLFANINAYVFAHRLRVAVVCRQPREMCAPCNMCDKLSGDMRIHVRVPARESAAWGVQGYGLFHPGPYSENLAKREPGRRKGPLLWSR